MSSKCADHIQLGMRPHRLHSQLAVVEVEVVVQEAAAVSVLFSLLRPPVVVVFYG